MSTSKKRAKRKFLRLNKRRNLLIGCTLLCVSLCGAAVATLNPLTPATRTSFSVTAVPVVSPTPLPVTKEYVYAGGKLVATEEPVNAAPTVSITSPTNNAVFLAPANITINATASDSDGTISKVEFYEGANLLNTDTVAPFSFAWNNVVAGTYSLTAKATDNNGAVTPSGAITVISNAAPTVSITSPANNTVLNPPANITINATASDSDGTISKVEFYQGTTLLNTDTVAPFSFAWNNVVAGTYSLTAKATDNNGAVSAASTAVTVRVNAAPTVSITSPANNTVFNPPANITINASASDSDGTISKVEFYQGTTLLNTDTVAPFSFAWNNVAAGTYSLTAKATDNDNLVSQASVAVTVRVNAAPTVSITSPANNAVFQAPGSITINANASDPDGTISKVEFYQGTTLLNTDTVAPYSFAWNNVVAGTYSLTAKATDNDNLVSQASAAVTVRVNAPPTVSITSPANNAVFTAPASITINASATDSDGTISKVEFYQGTTLLNTDTVAPFSFAWNNVVAGTYSLTAKATDNDNALTPSGPINITVNPGCTPPVGIIISEFRLRGPNGSNDEYIELYNNTDAGITVCTADGSSGWALVSSEGTTRFVLAAGTAIPARAHYLAVAGGYSLSGYSGSTSGNLSYVTDIPENSGLALFNTSNSSNFTLANRFDAVGFTSSGTLYREGAGLTLLGANAGQYCFLRKLNTGIPQDTGDNPGDFTFVATDAGVYGALTAILGGPGPENLSSPLQRNATMPVTVIDPAVGANVAPNRVRDTTAIGPNAAAGTLSVRRTITNNTGANVTRLRFRITDITTLNTPGYTPGGAQADMRVLSCSDFTATITGGAQVLVRGTTLETPPAQAMGGGLHSSLSVGVISLSQPLAPGQSISVQFLLGVQQSGTFRFFFAVEALP